MGLLFQSIGILWAICGIVAAIRLAWIGRLNSPSRVLLGLLVCLIGGGIALAISVLMESPKSTDSQLLK